MPNLKDLKNRIDSVKSTKKITQAMQMVAAAKLRRAEEAAQNARPYANRFEAVLGRLAASVGDNPMAPMLLRGTGQRDTHLLVVMTGDRGLCGGFNANIVKKAKAKIAELQDDGKTVKLMTVGKKGRDILKREHGDKIVEHYEMGDTKNTDYRDAQKVATEVIDRFEAGEFDVAWIFYAEYENALSQHPKGQQLIPAQYEAPDDDDMSAVYEYEPDEESILADLLPKGVASQIFAAMLENQASEQGARMTAMDNATQNAEDMIEDLNRDYNRTRQAAITNELIEIISGAEAL